jgi:hypothetical protein
MCGTYLALHPQGQACKFGGVAVFRGVAKLFQRPFSHSNRNRTRCQSSLRLILLTTIFKVREQLSSRVAIHYPLPELTLSEAKAIIERGLADDATAEVVAQIALGGMILSRCGGFSMEARPPYVVSDL